jgi:hypothetical protein
MPRSHCGAQRFAFNWGLALVRANLEQRTVERSYGCVSECSVATNAASYWIVTATRRTLCPPELGDESLTARPSSAIFALTDIRIVDIRRRVQAGWMNLLRSGPGPAQCSDEGGGIVIHEMDGTRTCLGGFYTGQRILF